MTRRPLRRFTPVHLRDRGLLGDRKPRHYEAADPSLTVARVIRLAAYLEALLASACAQLGIAGDLGRMLLALAERPTPERPTDIARMLGVSRSTVSRLLVRGEDAGWFERRRMAGSDRETMVFITRKGRALSATLEQASAAELLSAIGTRTVDLAAINNAVRSLERVIEPDWSPFDHAATSSKWRSRRWTEDTGWGDEWFDGLSA